MRNPGTLLGVIAIVLALAGSAVALPGKDTVNGGDVKSNSIKSRHLRDGKVKSADIGDGEVKTADVEESLRPGPEPLWAVVRAFTQPAELVHQQNAVGLERISEGVYEVRFNRSVSECSFAATSRGGNSFATVINTALNPPAGLDADEVHVSLFDSDGNPVDRDFSVQIIC
jgi:hypothetical protein